MSQLDGYSYRGARALVLLHEQHLREFVAVWRRFRAANIALPATEDPAYASPEALLRHILGAARGYMTWMCEHLKLPDPQIRPVPEEGAIEGEADAFLEHVLERWRRPLVDVPEDAFETPYMSRWKVPYCVDAMLEHAVMHPIRHTFQLQELLQQAGR
jgi:uncharacterized damage-inducible protein DinB